MNIFEKEESTILVCTSDNGKLEINLLRDCYCIYHSKIKFKPEPTCERCNGTGICPTEAGIAILKLVASYGKNHT